MSVRTPAQIQRFLDDTAHRMDLPSQYLGDEPNSYRRDWDSAAVRWIVAASWPYEAAAGNQSIPAVYKAINEATSPWGSQYLADRWYLPATPRDLRMFERAGIPVFGIESKRQFADFDVVSTSIAYALLAISFIKYLGMSDIPVRWRDRAECPEKYPMVMVGGLSFGAPEHLAPVVDCWWLGEAEEEPGNPGIGAVCQRIEQFKIEGVWSTDRLACYRALAREFNFLYFPRFVAVEYGYEDRQHVGLPEPSKQVMSYTTAIDGLRAPFVKRIVKDMDNVAPLDNAPLLYADPGMGTGDIEVGRGCPAWCSFCALTYRQKPYRQRSVPYMVDFAARSYRNQGATHLTPFMPDFPMHTQRKKLIASLMERVSDEVDAPAMRVDDYISDPDCVLLQVHAGMDDITLGVEGNSQRMRDLVGKGCSDEDIKEAVTRAIRAGIRKIKLFMIAALPGEDEGDVFRALRLAKDLADIRDSANQPNIRIQFSWTPLLIEANTPFQWFPVTTNVRALGDVWEEFRDLQIDFKLGAKGEPNKSAYFQLQQRASREVGEVLVDAAESFGTACWGGVPRHTRELLETKLRERGFLNGLDDCFDERGKNDMFGYEFIDQGVSVELLWVTYQSMREFVEETDSHTYDLNFDDRYHGNEWVERCDTRCLGKTCGCCDQDDLRLRRRYIVAAQQEAHVEVGAVKPIDQKSVAMKVRARLVKPEAYRFVMNDHWRFNLRRALYRAQHALGLEWGVAKRSIRFASDGTTKIKDWTCGVDYAEFGLTQRVGRTAVGELIAAANIELDQWMQLGEWRLHPATAATMRTDTDLCLYQLELDADPHTALARVREWHAADYVKVVLRPEATYFGPSAIEVNAKEFCDDLWLVRDGHRLLLRLLLRGRPTVYNIASALLTKGSWLDVAAYPAVRLEAFVQADQNQMDFFRPSCQGCERLIPVNIFEQPYDPDYCPRCQDVAAGRAVTELVGVASDR